ncbi:uncharacterized protein [Triticum aestivum]|uniref:uncharacterized protein n=1 Tax=Triticum aestivum TaxID=4565 RepID=UPI001D00AE6E|nr:uncharacterized protein LOC123076696 [Triticum aestivum]
MSAVTFGWKRFPPPPLSSPLPPGSPPGSSSICRPRLSLSPIHGGILRRVHVLQAARERILPPPPGRPGPSRRPARAAPRRGVEAGRRGNPEGEPSGGADDDGGSGVRGGAAAGRAGGGRVGAESKAWHTAPVVMQVVDTVGIPPLAVRHGMPGGRVERYSLVLSDGLHTMEIKLITPLRHLVRDGCVRRGSVVRLLWYCTIFDQIASTMVDGQKMSEKLFIISIASIQRLRCSVLVQA